MLTIVTALAQISFSTVLAVLIFGLIGERAGMVLWRRVADGLKVLPPAHGHGPVATGALARKIVAVSGLNTPPSAPPNETQ